MQGIGLQSLAFILAGHLPQDTHTVDVNAHGNSHDGHAPERRRYGTDPFHQSQHAFIDHPEAGQEQQHGFRQGGKIFNLAVSVGMPTVGRAGRDAHRRQGHGRRQQIEAAVQRFGKNAQTVSVQAHDQLQAGQGKGSEQRGQRGAVFFGGTVFVPVALHNYSR